jgi:hypothetical protein
VNTASPSASHATPIAAADSARPSMVYQRVLPMNRCLNVGDCIVSGNRMFFAILEADGQLRVYRGACPESEQGVLWASGRGGEGGRFFALVQTDGNFCIYRGGDLSTNEGWHWGTQMTAEGGQFHATMNNDGSFSVCRGSDPAIAREPVWNSGATDPVASIDAIDRIDYDLGAALQVASRPSDLYRETVSNHNDRIQTSMISGSVTVSDTTGWCDELGPGALAPNCFKGPVPVLSCGKVVLSGDAGHAYLRNGASTTAKIWGFNAPAAVPPNSAMMCLVAAIRSSVIVPYTLHGTFTLASGRQVSGSVDGTYSGSNYHDLSVTLTTYDPNPTGSYTISRPLTPMPSISGTTTQHPIGASTFH